MCALLYDLCELIFAKLDVVSQIRFRQTTRFLSENLQITDFLNVDSRITNILSNNIIHAPLRGFASLSCCATITLMIF